MIKRFSVRNAHRAKRDADGKPRRCTCRPYFEILAKGMWAKQKLFPRPGERPTLVRVWFGFARFNRHGGRTSRRLLEAQLYCRCQVATAEANQRAAAKTAIAALQSRAVRRKAA